MLNNVDQHTSGKFSCEVTEAAPSFHTLIVSKDMNVIGKKKFVLFWLRKLVKMNRIERIEQNRTE